MATLNEIAGSRQSRVHRLGMNQVSSVDVKYNVFDAVDDLDVHATCNRFFTANRIYSVGGLDMLVQYYEISHLGGSVWEVSAHYESRGADETSPDTRARSFDTAGSSVLQTQAFSETGYAAAGQTAPSMGNAINVQDGMVQGVEVLTPALTWSETYDIPHSFITNAYIKGLASMTGCINNAAWRSFGKHEVLFMGASGSQQWDSEAGNGPWKITFKFSASSSTTLEVNGMSIQKSGWDYIWFVYKDTTSTQGNNQIPAKEVQFAYVNQVYRDAPFTALGIGP